MDTADIKRIAEGQGLTVYINERPSRRGDGRSHISVRLRKPGQRRPPVLLGGMTQLARMSEADVVGLIETKMTQSPAQKGKE